MAFNSANLTKVSPANVVGPSFFLYNTTTDDVADVSAGDYFTPFADSILQSLLPNPFNVGDSIQCTCTDGLVDIIVTSIDPITSAPETVTVVIGPNSVNTAAIQNLAVTTGKIANNAVTAAQIANTTITNSQISASAGIAYSKLAALPSADVVLGSAGNVATATAVTGDVTISNSGVTSIGAGKVTGSMLANPLLTTSGVLTDFTTASATPGTIRALTGVAHETNATMTSGNVVGVRGEVDMVGASGGFAYGVQGKVIPTGTLSGSVWAPAVFGQYDLSSATINAGQIAAVWGDMGATGGTFTDVTGARMFAGTNTIASLTLFAMDYRYGKASNLFELDGNAGTYITAGGATPSGSIVKIAISIDGVQYYLQAATVYS